MQWKLSCWRKRKSIIVCWPQRFLQYTEIQWRNPIAFSLGISCLATCESAGTTLTISTQQFLIIGPDFKVNSRTCNRLIMCLLSVLGPLAKIDHKEIREGKSLSVLSSYCSVENNLQTQMIEHYFVLSKLITAPGSRNSTHTCTDSKEFLCVVRIKAFGNNIPGNLGWKQTAVQLLQSPLKLMAQHWQLFRRTGLLPHSNPRDWGLVTGSPRHSAEAEALQALVWLLHTGLTCCLYQHAPWLTPPC